MKVAEARVDEFVVAYVSGKQGIRSGLMGL